MAKHLVFDTETTDLIKNTVISLSKQPEMFEFFGVSVSTDTLTIGEEKHIFCKPTKKMAEGAKKATGKNDDFVKDFFPFKTYANELKDFIESHDAIVAHNLNFDKNILLFEFERVGVEIKLPKLVCTIEKTEDIFGYRLSLTALYQYLFPNEDFGNKHNADADVRALARCYIELIKRGEM